MNMKSRVIVIVVSLVSGVGVALSSDSQVMIPAALSRNEQNKLDNSLLHAAEQGDVVRLRALYDAGADANASNDTGITPLMAAIQGSAAQDLRAALSPSDLAAIKEDLATDRYVSTIDFLLSKGAYINAVANQPNTYTALMLAAWQANPQIVEKLLRYTPDLERADATGRTALMLAVHRLNPGSEAEKIEKMQLLIEAGANMNARNLADKSIEDYVGENNSKKLIKIFQKYQQIERDRKLERQKKESSLQWQ